MSTQDPKWERELRSRLREHEFGFEPAAWTQMAGLLDKAVPPAKAGGTEGGGPAPSQSGTAGGGWSAGLFTKVMIGLVALGVAAAILLRKEPVTNAANGPEATTRTEATTPSVPSPPVEIPSVVAPESMGRTAFAETGDEPEAAPGESPGVALVAPLAPKNVLLEPAPREWPSPLVRSPQITMKLPRTDLSSLQLAVPNRLPSDSLLRARLRVPLSRKRNRKTLFPDVIEKN